jgi:hypothetical protein
MSGWTRALHAGASQQAARPLSAAPSSDEADTTIFFGQVASHRESADYTSWLQQVAAEEAGLEAQQEMMDYLRERMEATGEDAGTATRTLASLGHALDHVSSTVFLPAQYAKVVDSIAWDLCDILLPALWTEWQRACRATQFGNAIQADDQMDVRFRPVTSASLSLLLHLLEQVALHASPREVALSLLAFFEANIQLAEELDDGEDEQDDEEQKASAKSQDPNALSPYHRLSLAFPLLDLLGQLLHRLNASPSSGSSAPSAAARTALSSRQIELYEQLLSVANQILLHVTDQAALREAAGGAERDAWAEMHSKLTVKCLSLLQPALGPASPASSAPTASGRSPQTLRSSVLSFLYAQLLRTYETYSTSANAIQSLLQGNVFQAAENGEQQVSLLTPSVSSIFTTVLSLCHSVSLCSVTPVELDEYFHARRNIEEALERAEMASWEREGEDGEEDDDADADGNVHDDEYSSSDSSENSAVLAAAAAEKRKPKSILVELRKQAKRMPSYSIPGVGCYVATVMTYRYFHHIKPERAAAAIAGASASAPASTPSTIDPSLTSFLTPYSTLGSSFLSSLLSLPGFTALSCLGPWFSALLFQASQKGDLGGVVRAVTGMVGVWACTPPGSASLPFDESIEDSGIWTLSEALLQTCFLCPPSWAAVRPMLLQEWKSLLSTLEPLTRVKLLQLSLSACSVASIQALILGRLKLDLQAGYEGREGSKEREVMEKMEVLAQLHANLTQSEMNLLGSVDFLLALVNLFTFLVLKEKKIATAQRDSAGEERTSSPPPTLGLTQPAVKQVWREKWTEVADAAEEKMNALNAELSSPEAGASSDEVNEKTLLRNQLQLTVELTRRLLEHMQG